MLCSLPVRFDTYRGCGHACAYCFAGRKCRLTNIAGGEGVKALCDWISGRRTTETNWCDWNLPLHWGGMSDPFQPRERTERRSLACLDVFVESGYPVVISTKGTLLAEPEYRARLRACNAAVQVSAVSSRLDQQEPGAPRFTERLRLLERLTNIVRRVIVRCQPYRPDLLRDVLQHLPQYRDAGVWGLTVEGLKNHRATPGMVKLGTDFVYPVDVLRRDFELIRERCHGLGLRFYAAENRLRAMGDDMCCCGVADLPGWRVNGANLNAPVAGRPIRYTRGMREVGTAGVFKSLAQDVISGPALRTMSYRDALEIVRRVPVYREIMGLQTSGTGALRTGSNQHMRSGAGRGDGATRSAATRPVGRSNVSGQRRELGSDRPRRGGRVLRRRGTGSRTARRPD